MAIGTEVEPVGLPQYLAEEAEHIDFHDRVDQLEVVMRRYPDFLLDIPPVHRVVEGIYTREITIPIGTLITGKIHRHKHLVMIAKGDATIWSEDTGVMRVQGPCVFESTPGARRVIYAHTETVWTTIHRSDNTSVEALEEELYLPHTPDPPDTTLGEIIFAKMVLYTMQEQGLLET